MTSVIHPAGQHVGTLSLSVPRKRPTVTGLVSDVQRQAAIENALSMALHFVRQPGSSAANLWAATARTNRALTLLKQAAHTHTCADRRE